MFPLNGGTTSEANAAITARLREWWHTHKAGRMVGPSAGFFLFGGSTLCPDAAYISGEKMQALDRGEWAGIPHICPDFVIELLANWEKPEELEEKMVRWIDNGVKLAWLIDPYRRAVRIHAPGRTATFIGGRFVHATSPVDGFSLDLDEIWRCYDD